MRIGTPHIGQPKALYTSRGEWAGLLLDDKLFNPMGEWVGFVVNGGRVYSVSGVYVGWLTKDYRILRKRADDDLHPRQAPPPNPGRIRPPATIPLAPLLPEVGYDTVDVLDEMPERLHPVDFDRDRADMD